MAVKRVRSASRIGSTEEPWFEKLVGLQGFSGADCASGAMVVTIAIKQTAVTAGPIASAPAPQLREQPGVLLGDDVSLARGAYEHQRIEHWTAIRAAISLGFREVRRANLQHFPE